MLFNLFLNKNSFIGNAP